MSCGVFQVSFRVGPPGFVLCSCPPCGPWSCQRQFFLIPPLFVQHDHGRAQVPVIRTGIPIPHEVSWPSVRTYHNSPKKPKRGSAQPRSRPRAGVCLRNGAIISPKPLSTSFDFIQTPGRCQNVYKRLPLPSFFCVHRQNAHER